MNVKGLLLGSAAALVAVSGARAADAVVIAEPEPMEYVRVCDTYGAGFYYIPGTETCLKVSGYLRHDIGIGHNGFLDVLDKEDGDLNDTYYKRSRFAFRTDARSETELGTVRAYAQINFNYDVGVLGDDEEFAGYTVTGNTWAVNHAYIELGGFRIGKTDSLFTTFTGYSSGVSNDGIIGYGPFDTHQIAYTFNGGNGFTAAIAVEEGNGVYGTIDSYTPHVTGGVGYTGGWGGVSAVVGYDSNFGETAAKARVDFNVNDAISLFVMGAWATDDAPNFYATWGGEWAAWVGGAWKFNDKATMNFEVGYNEWEDVSVAVNLDYELVNNLHIIPEITYYDVEGDLNDDDDWGGFLRVQYNWGG